MTLDQNQKNNEVDAKTAGDVPVDLSHDPKGLPPVPSADVSVAGEEGIGELVLQQGIFKAGEQFRVLHSRGKTGFESVAVAAADDATIVSVSPENADDIRSAGVQAFLAGVPEGSEAIIVTHKGKSSWKAV